MGIQSHIQSRQSQHHIALSKLHPWNSSYCGNREQKVPHRQGRGEESPVAWDQLSGQPKVISPPGSSPSLSQDSNSQRPNQLYYKHWDLKSRQLAPSSFAKLLQKSPPLILLSHLVCQPRSQQRWWHPVILLFAWPFCLISSSAAASRGPWGQDAALMEAAPVQLAVPPLPRHALHSYSDRHIRPFLKHQKSGIWRALHIHTAVHTHPTDGPPIPTEKSGPMQLAPRSLFPKAYFLSLLAGSLTACSKPGPRGQGETTEREKPLHIGRWQG